MPPNRTIRWKEPRISIPKEKNEKLEDVNVTDTEATRQRRAVRWKSPGTVESPYKRRQRTDPNTIHPEAVWESLKGEILELRKTQTVKQVAETMAAKGFLASEPQYKNHLKQWGDKQYVRWTENQLAYIIPRLIERLEIGKKPAVRLDGKKVPSRRIERYFTNHQDLVGRFAEQKRGEDAPGENLAKLSEGLENDRDDVIADSFLNAPTFIDSIRVTVYTSSTGRGIASLFSRAVSEPEGNRGSIIAPLYSAFEDEDVHASNLDRLKNMIRGPLVNASSPASEENKNILQESFSMDNAWKKISIHMFDGGYVNHNGVPWPVVVTDFSPDFVTDSITGRRMLVVEKSKFTRMRESIRTRQGIMRFLKDGPLELTRFLESSGGLVQLYLRDIDINDCPEGVWAVDMGRALRFDWSSASEHIGICAITRRRDFVMTCKAWCTRSAAEWSEYQQDTNHRRYGYSCGHDTSSAATDGPVIFTRKLNRNCWRGAGCQYVRINSSTKSCATADRDRTFMPWSYTSSTLDGQENVNVIRPSF